jgi:hypothetical protein
MESPSMNVPSMNFATDSVIELHSVIELITRVKHFNPWSW